MSFADWRTNLTSDWQVLRQLGDTVAVIDNLPPLPLPLKRGVLPNPDAIGISAMGENLARAGVGFVERRIKFS